MANEEYVLTEEQMRKRAGTFSTNNLVVRSSSSTIMLKPCASKDFAFRIRGNKEAAYKLCGFDASKPVIMVIRIGEILRIKIPTEFARCNPIIWNIEIFDQFSLDTVIGTHINNFVA